MASTQMYDARTRSRAAQSDAVSFGEHVSFVALMRSSSAVTGRRKQAVRRATCRAPCSSPTTLRHNGRTVGEFDPAPRPEAPHVRHKTCSH